MHGREHVQLLLSGLMRGAVLGDRDEVPCGSAEHGSWSETCLEDIAGAEVGLLLTFNLLILLHFKNGL